MSLVPYPSSVTRRAQDKIRLKLSQSICMLILKHLSNKSTFLKNLTDKKHYGTTSMGTIFKNARVQHIDELLLFLKKTPVNHFINKVWSGTLGHPVFRFDSG